MLNISMHYEQDPKLLSYFLSRQLTEERLVQLTVTSKRKKEITLELMQLNISVSVLASNLLHSVENRFWLYNKNSILEGQEYSFCFQKVDFTNNTFLFSPRRRQLQLDLLTNHFFNCSQSLLLNNKNRSLLKGRFLYMVKGGYSFLCFGKKVFFQQPNFFNQKILFSSYKFWFLKNFYYYGFLKHLVFRGIELKKKDLRDNLFYYRKNQRINFLVDVGLFSKDFYTTILKK